MYIKACKRKRAKASNVWHVVFSKACYTHTQASIAYILYTTSLYENKLETETTREMSVNNIHFCISMAREDQPSRFHFFASPFSFNADAHTFNLDLIWASYEEQLAYSLSNLIRECAMFSLETKTAFHHVRYNIELTERVKIFESLNFICIRFSSLTYGGFSFVSWSNQRVLMPFMSRIEIRFILVSHT